MISGAGLKPTTLEVLNQSAKKEQRMPFSVFLWNFAGNALCSLQQFRVGWSSFRLCVHSGSRCQAQQRAKPGSSDIFPHGQPSTAKGRHGREKCTRPFPFYFLLLTFCCPKCATCRHASLSRGLCENVHLDLVIFCRSQEPPEYTVLAMSTRSGLSDFRP